MIKQSSSWASAFAVVASVAWNTGATVAHADLGACGDINVQAKAECQVVAPSVQCEAMCTPVSVRAACAGQLAVACRADCNQLPSVSCQGECAASCQADCDKLDPGSFDCRGSCQLDCSGRCSGNCASNGDKTSCEASCKGSCAASCDASCKVEPPQVDCKAGCTGSCKGSCEVDPNLDCQAKCQAKGEVQCQVDVEGGCKAQCKQQEGALFCDGEYVDHAGKLQECIDALRAAVNAHVTAEAHGTSGCDDAGVCAAEGSASVKSNGLCSVVTPGAPHGYPAWLAFVALTGLVLARRRKAR